MTKVVVGPLIHAPLDESRFAQNGDMLSGNALRRVSSQYNRMAVNQRKLLFAIAHNTQSTPAPTATPQSLHTFCFRTGENVKSVAMLVGMAPASATDGTNTASVEINMYDGTSTLTSAKCYYPKVQSGLYTPAEVAWSWAEITTDDGLLADTEYRIYLRQYSYARIHSVCFYEIGDPIADSSTTGICNQLAFEEAKPVYDADIQSLAQTGTTLWRHNATQLMSYSRKDVASMLNVVGSSYSGANWRSLYHTGGAYDATKQGFIFSTQYHDTHASGVPVTLGVYAARTAGTGTLSVKFVSAGGTLLTKTGIVSQAAPFDSSQHTVTAAAATKYDVLLQCSDSSTNFDILAIGLWEYEA